MAGISKTVSSSSVPENRYNSINLGEPLHLPSQVESHVEPYELVELFYGSHSVSSNDQVNHSSPHSPQTPPQVIEQSPKTKAPSTSYKCEICSRVFKEASHFSKHKRGALCRKSAQKLAKRNKKKILKEKESSEKKNKHLTNPYKPYQCNLCGAKFLDKVNVELHLERTHQTRQPLWLQTSKSGGFACSECDLWFVDKSQLRQHQQQHSNVNHAPTPHQNEPPVVQQPLPQQPMPPPPPQYYFQPLQHIQTFTTNQIHQLGPPPHQTMQQMGPQMGPPQGHPVPTFVVPHPHNHQNPTTVPQPSHHQPVPNNCLNSQQVPMSSSNPTQPPSNPPAETSKPVKVSKVSYSNSWTISRRNICGECGLKFVDPINLELHMQRKHPSSSIVETVGLGGGLTLYKTNNSNGNIDTVSGEVSSTKTNNNQTFDCVLCGFKASSMGNIVKHLQSVHNTSNANFIYVNLADNSNEKQSKVSKHSGKDFSDSDFEENKCRCDSCSKEFESRAALIRHTIKEKNILCGICNFNSCSDAKVASHMYSLHKQVVHGCSFDQKMRNYIQQRDHTHPNSNSSCNQSESVLSGENDSLTGTISSFSPDQSLNKEEDSYPPRLLCCMCDFYALSGVSLAQHLESHGSIHVKCGKCDEFSERFIDINNHISSSHAGEVTKVSITMKASESPSVYMFMITPLPNFPNGTQEDLDVTTETNAGKTPDEKVQSESNETEDDYIAFSDDDPIYACSDCVACLTGSSQLEAHIVIHQSSNRGANGSPDNQNQQYLVASSPNYHSNTSSPPTKVNPLLHTRSTIEFRCKECGFWRVKSDPVIRHIQAVHMSGNMVHSLRLKSGQIKTLTIKVFTPLSSSVLS